jgi:hypothetical protein
MRWSAYSKTSNRAKGQMMKHFEWTLELPEEERERLLKIYPDVRKAYDLNGIQGIIDFRSDRKRQIDAKKEENKEHQYRAKMLERIVHVVSDWHEMYDPDRVILDLIAEHNSRLLTDEEYALKVKSRSIRPIIFDSQYDDNLLPYVYLSDAAWEKRLIFTDSRFAFDANMTLTELRESIVNRIKDLGKKVESSKSFDLEKAKNTLNFISILEYHLLEVTTSYFPKFEDLHAYMMEEPKKTKGKRGEGNKRYNEQQKQDWREIYEDRLQRRGYSHTQIAQKINEELRSTGKLRGDKEISKSSILRALGLVSTNKK